MPSRSSYFENNMNIGNLIRDLEFQIDLQDLKKLGLSEREIEGFIEFEWDLCAEKNLNLLFIEENISAQH